MTEGTVVTWPPGTATATNRHARQIVAIARMIAELKGRAFVGDDREDNRSIGPRYVVPADTIVGMDPARCLGIATPDDLYGGVVPFAFQATKAIAHGIVAASAHRPVGWRVPLARELGRVVLPGYTAFSPWDARVAFERLRRHGPVRAKRGRGAGRQGQAVLTGIADLEAFLAGLDPGELARFGLVLERNLEDVTTYCVGQVEIAGITASYVGVQHQTRDNRGRCAYGGSDLTIVCGGFEELGGLDLPRRLRLAVGQAVAFDRAVRADPRIIASRRNYDVLQGVDRAGCFRSGVVDQSWRIGGASGPEVVALRAFQADPALQVVEASSVERYGPDVRLPPEAIVHVTGADPADGPIACYTVRRSCQPALGGVRPIAA